MTIDKTVYIIGADMEVTLWTKFIDGTPIHLKMEGDAGTIIDEELYTDSTGLLTKIYEIPRISPDGISLDRGELMHLSATYGSYKWELDLYTSNFGATIETDKKTYLPTDIVHITTIAPDHNSNSGIVDQIGDTDDDPLIIQTRSQKLTGYILTETGTDTGIFTGQVQLMMNITSSSGNGPTDGILKAEDDDGVTISYEYNEDEVIVGSALIRGTTTEVIPDESESNENNVPSSGTNVIVENAQGSSTPGCEPNCFIPALTIIDVGGQVTFANNDAAAHTSTSGTPADGPSGAWDSSLVMTGSSYTTPPLPAGEYPYFCAVHPWMEGKIIVQ